MKRLRSMYARRRCLDVDGPDGSIGVHVGGDLDGFVSPTQLDPILVKRSNEKLAECIAAHANYGRIDKEVMTGSDGVPRWYAFRYAEHPPDAGIPSPHPGVDYLVGPAYQGTSTGIAARGGLAAVAILGVAFLLMAGGNKR